MFKINTFCCLEKFKEEIRRLVKVITHFQLVVTCAKNFTFNIVFSFLQTNVITLHPPHYDSVTCLTLYQKKLFSACNKTLKQWSMKSQNPTIMQVGSLTCIFFIYTYVYICFRLTLHSCVVILDSYIYRHIVVTQLHKLNRRFCITCMLCLAVLTQTNDSAHQTMITGLATVKQSPFLISSCKNGYMKCWDTETLSLTGINILKSYCAYIHYSVCHVSCN